MWICQFFCVGRGIHLLKILLVSSITVRIKYRCNPFRILGSFSGVFVLSAGASSRWCCAELVELSKMRPADEEAGVGEGCRVGRHAASVCNDSTVGHVPRRHRQLKLNYQE